MTPTERNRIVERLAVEGLDALVRDAALRDAVRGDAELRALVRALADVDGRLAALPTPPAPEALVTRAIAAGREVTPDPVALETSPAPVASAPATARSSRWLRAVDTVVAFSDRMPIGVRVVGGSLAVGALALVVAVPALLVTRGGDSANTDDMPIMADGRFATAVVQEEMEWDESETAAYEDRGEGAFGGDGWAEDAPAEAPARMALGGEVTDEMNGLGGLGALGTGSGGGGMPSGSTGLGGRGLDGLIAGNDDGDAFGRGPGAMNRPAGAPRSTSSTTARMPAAAPASPPPPPADPAPDNGYVDQTVREGRVAETERSRLAPEGGRGTNGRGRPDQGQRQQNLLVDDLEERAFEGVEEEGEMQLGHALNSAIGQRGALAEVFGEGDDALSNDFGGTLAPGDTGVANGDFARSDRSSGRVQTRTSPDADDDGRFAYEVGNARDGAYRQERSGELAQELDREQTVATLTFQDGQTPDAVVDPNAVFDIVLEEPEEATEEEAAPANAYFNQRAGQDGERLAAFASSPDRALAASWLAERERVDGVETQPATGYWRNTYVPGDPLVRGLQQQVREAGGAAAGLLDGARRPAQPYDPPTNAAMAVYVHADQSAVDGPRRMLVEVGLQGTERQTGRRPAMNVGVVLDLRSADASDSDAVCALMESLADARDIGDRFSIVVAGREGELLVPADGFGWGAVRVACDRLFGDEADLGRGGLDLATAWDRAFDTVLATDDPTAALGSSFVWVVSPGLSPMDTALLEGRAHTAAVDGVPTSVVGLNGGGDTALLDRVALAGQGHRRLVGSAEDAEAVVDAEITAISRVVARAVRLRIRLAPGVQLVDVLGSERLDEARAEQVRQAEQAIDQRLSRNLGIQADRGDDEDGIQIVIPAFMADDHHVILLDVIADGPGAVVDVTARYKDLVHLRNGVSRAHLSLPRGDVEPGPLALNVRRNLVAWDVARALTSAGAQMDAGSRDAAIAELRRAASLVRGLRAMVPGFATDVSLDADLELLADAIATTGGAPHGDPAVARALRAAGWLKLFTAPDTGDDR